MSADDDRDRDQAEGIKAGALLFAELLRVGRESGSHALAKRIAELSEDEVRFALFATIGGLLAGNDQIAGQMDEGPDGPTLN